MRSVKTRTIILISLMGIIALLLVCLALASNTAALKQSMTDTETGYQTSALRINDKIPDFQADAFHKNNITRINISDYRGKWLVFIFYPADFTFVCPTELEEMASLYKNFTDQGAEVFSISRDTIYVHRAWHDSDPRINKVEFPMLSDTTGDICRAFGTYNESNGLSRRASFIFDPDGNLKAMEIHDDSFGRNTKELLRELEAAKFVRENQGKVCPASWKPGEEAIQP
jgi:peroxiredoxin (alkyl hydroperoxide reductase subunit C)